MKGLTKRDPKLLERRIKAGLGAEKQLSQQVIQSLAALAFILIFILSALDHRFNRSAVPVAVDVAGDIFVAFGLGIVFFVFRENSFASATIEVGVGQTLVSSGPYGVVRHPMYFGAFIMLVGAPVALSSWWGCLRSFRFSL
jgi:protein-S-isoprenylcysteine O-methyltransferase Ste14